jgi:hypothetical protein
MSIKKPAPGLPENGKRKAGFGAVCAVLGAMAVQASFNGTSAATLSGTFGFAPKEIGTDVPVATFVGSTLANGLSVTFAASTPTSPFNLPYVQNEINTYVSGATFNSKANDFDAVAYPSSFALALGGIVTLNPSDLTLTVMNLNDPTNIGFVPDPHPNFLIFAAPGLPTAFGTPGGTSPVNRFVYDLLLVKWSSNNAVTPNNLDFNSLGLLHDTYGVFQDWAAELNFGINVACTLSANCTGSNLAWTFATNGTGGHELVPEPMTLSLLGVAFAGLVAVRRRRG